MLPQSHIGYTLLAAKLAQRWVPAARNADFRWLALAAVTPDLLDKPVVVATYPRWGATKLLAHSGVWHLAVGWLVTRHRPGWIPYLFALHGHLLADGLWRQPDTLFWPALGPHFYRRERPQGRKWGFLTAYRHYLRRSSGIRYLEAGGILALLCFFWLARLFRADRLRRFLTTGRI